MKVTPISGFPEYLPAERIIEHREANGPFRTIDELEAVRGISARMVDEMRAMITVGP